MKTFEPAAFEIIRIETEDIIVTSNRLDGELIWQDPEKTGE